MSKHQKAAPRKRVREAASVRMDRNKQGIKLIVATAVAIAICVIYFFNPIAVGSQVRSILVFAFFLVLAVLLGELGVRYSKLNTEYTKLKNLYGINDAEVKEMMADIKAGR